MKNNDILLNAIGNISEELIPELSVRKNTELLDQYL